MSEDKTGKGIPVLFETFIPPAEGPGGSLHSYEFTDPYLRSEMNAKILNNIKHFGSVEKFLAHFSEELVEKRDAAEAAVRTYEMRRLQLNYLRDWVSANATKKSEVLDG